jgi:hypothetical protein
MDIGLERAQEPRSADYRVESTWEQKLRFYGYPVETEVQKLKQENGGAQNRNYGDYSRLGEC